MYNRFCFDVIMAILLFLGLILAIAFTSSNTLFGQQSYGYYECDNDERQYVKFEAPDTITKRMIATRFYSCYPLPQTVLFVPEGGYIIGVIKNSDENPIYQYQRGR